MGLWNYGYGPEVGGGVFTPSPVSCPVVDPCPNHSCKAAAGRYLGLNGLCLLEALQLSLPPTQYHHLSDRASQGARGIGRVQAAAFKSALRTLAAMAKALVLSSW